MRSRIGKFVVVLESNDLDAWYDGVSPLTKVTKEYCTKYDPNANGESYPDDYDGTVRAVGTPYTEYVVSAYEKGVGWQQLGVSRKKGKAYRIAERRANVYITKGFEAACRA